MQKSITLSFFLLGCFYFSFAQVKIHSHNDYDKPRPFRGAYEQQAYSIEADVYVVNNDLAVAHTRNEIRPGHTLDSMYLDPIIHLFQQFHGRPSHDPHYTFQLMIDVKEKPEKVLQLLIQKILPYRKYFDRRLNPMAIKVVISGDRPPIADYIKYPPFIFFDGRPYEKYDGASLAKVAMISDSFEKYSHWKGQGRMPEADRDTLQQIIRHIHEQGKLVRFWATPDTPESWKQFHQLGVDLINTDDVAACKKYFLGNGN